MSNKKSLNIFFSCPKERIPTKKLEEITAHFYDNENIPALRKINLICCGDHLIRKLNCIYRQVDRITDVLSFPFSEEDLLGEIYISLRRTHVQARRFGVTFKNEFIRLFIHGLLHLAGYDHNNPREKRIMVEKEALYLDVL